MRFTMTAAVAACLYAAQLGWSACSGEEIRFSVYASLGVFQLGEPVDISVVSTNVSAEALNCSGLGNAGWWVDVVAEDGAVVDGFSQPDTPWGMWTLSWPAHAYRELGRYRWDQTYHGEDLNRWDEPVSPGRYRVELRFEPLGDVVVASFPFLVCDAFGCEGPAGYSTAYVPAVANTTGFNGTRWRTELVFEKVGPSLDPVEVNITLLERDQDNRDARTALVQVGWCPPVTRIDNVLSELFGAEGIGAMRITTLAPGIAVSSRTVTEGPDGGEFGVSIPAIDPLTALPPNTIGIITELEWAPRRSRTGARTNIGLLNVGSEPAALEFLFAHTLPSNHVSPLGDLVTVDLPPFGFRQMNDVLDGTSSVPVANAFAVLRLTEGAGVIAYGAVVDNATGDTRFRQATVAPEYLRPSIWD